MEEIEEDGEEGKESNGNLFLAAEYLHRVVEVAIASSSMKKTKSAHGIEDRIGRRFWAPDSDSEIEANEVDHLATCMSKLATNPSPSELNTSWGSVSSTATYNSAVAAEVATLEMKHTKEVSSSTPRTLAKRSGDNFDANRKIQPWRGPLPPPRTSPRWTFGDALASAQVRIKPRSKNTTSSSPKFARPSSSSLPSSAARQGSNHGSGITVSGRDLGDSNSKAASFPHRTGLERDLGSSIDSISRMNRNQGLSKGRRALCLSPHVS
jgi:hypothetical protein